MILGYEEKDALFEPRAAGVEVPAEPRRDEDVADRGEAVREASDDSDVEKAEVEEAVCVEAFIAQSSALVYVYAIGEGDGARDSQKRCCP